MRLTALRYLALALILLGAVTGGSALARGVASPAAAPVLHLLRVDGARLAYREINPQTKGTPLLLIVGYGSTMADWDPQLLNGLARGRRVIIFDNRGAGDSTGSVNHLSVRRMANDAAGMIQDLKLGRADVLGWSMGGFIAQELALDHPQLVRRLILASTDPGSPHSTPGRPAVIRTLTDPATTVTQLLSILFPSSQRTAARTWLNAIASQPGVTLRDFAVSARTKAAQKKATHAMWLGPGDGTYARLPAIRARTLVGYGSDDVIVPPANAEILLKRIPHAKGLRFAHAGHAFLFQDPNRSARGFAAFLDNGS